MAYGTLTLSDTLAATTTLIAAYGEQRVYDAFAVILQSHNDMINEMLDDLTELSSDRLRRFGGVSSVEMIEADEFATADAQKVTQGANIGFPLKAFTATVQWSRLYMLKATVKEINATFQAIMTEDLRVIRRQIATALFNSTDNLNYLDKRVDNLNVPVKALINADGDPIIPDAFGNTFNGSTHTHYLATAALTEADVLALGATVAEHYNFGNVKIFINKAQETAVRAFTNFKAYQDIRLSIPQNAQFAINANLDINNLYNRAIGLLNGYEVWVKPWILASYMFAYNPDAPKPLVYRTRSGSASTLAIMAEYEEYPLRARFMEREFGIGVYERTNGAILYIGGGAYVNPTTYP